MAHAAEPVASGFTHAIMTRCRIVGETTDDLPRPRTVAITELPAFVEFTRAVRRRLNTASVIE
jgi:hypothetical protein